MVSGTEHATTQPTNLLIYISPVRLDTWQGHTTTSKGDKPMTTQEYKVTGMMTLARDGMYHGLVATGREIIVSPRLIEENYHYALPNEEYPGQADFWTHDPGQWSGGLESGVYPENELYWA